MLCSTSWPVDKAWRSPSEMFPPIHLLETSLSVDSYFSFSQQNPSCYARGSENFHNPTVSPDEHQCPGPCPQCQDVPGDSFLEILKLNYSKTTQWGSLGTVSSRESVWRLSSCWNILLQSERVTTRSRMGLVPCRASRNSPQSNIVRYFPTPSPSLTVQQEQPNRLTGPVEGVQVRDGLGIGLGEGEAGLIGPDLWIFTCICSIQLSDSPRLWSSWGSKSWPSSGRTRGRRPPPQWGSPSGANWLHTLTKRVYLHIEQRLPTFLVLYLSHKSFFHQSLLIFSLGPGRDSKLEFSFGWDEDWLLFDVLRNTKVEVWLIGVVIIILHNYYWVRSALTRSNRHQ